MDEEEELENMLIGQNQRRTNTRPEEIAVQFSEGSSDLLDTALLGAGATSLAKKVAPESVVSSVGNFLQKNPNLQSVAKNLTSVGGKAAKITNVPLFAYTVADSAVRESTGKGISERAGEEIGGAVGNLLFPGAKERSAFTAAPTLQALADQKAQGAMTEDDKVDNLQKALQSVPDTPQVVPGTLPTPQEAGQRLIDAAKEFYPGAFPAETPAAPAAPAAPALPDPARTALTTEQMQGLSPDALQAIRTPSIPESVTSAEVPAGLGPLRPVDPRTGEFLSPEVIAAGERAGLTFPSQVALPQEQAPASLPPMSEAETRARLQQRFGAPTISQLQSVAQPQETERDARVQDRDRRPGESQTERDTRLANEKVTRSVSAQGRSFTDSELRRAFGDDYQEARIKDANGINPFTDVSYEKERLDRENLIADTEYRKRTGVDDPDNPTKVIEDARAQAEALAELYGLTKGTPEYDEYVRSAVAEKLGFPEYFKPVPRLTDAEANALYEKGEIGIGYEYINEKGERGKYEPEEKAAESEGKKDPRSRAAEARKNR
jgi:hypothetical protein